MTRLRSLTRPQWVVVAAAIVAGCGHSDSSGGSGSQGATACGSQTLPKTFEAEDAKLDGSAADVEPRHGREEQNQWGAKAARPGADEQRA